MLLDEALMETRGEIRSPVTHATSKRPRLFAEFITSEKDIKHAQRLRYEVFCKEYNVTLPVNETWNGLPIDSDSLDQHCHHLVVRDNQTMKPVGYTRVMTGEQAENLGRFYSSNEFEIDNIVSLPGRKMEIGRTCIHADYRNGATVAVLWAKLAQFMMQHKYQYLFGCASISLADGGTSFANIMPRLRDHHSSDKTRRVIPKLSFKMHEVTPADKVTFPPLLKAYTRMGAVICGEACWDPEFNVADVFVLLEIDKIEARYAKRFLKS